MDLHQTKYVDLSYPDLTNVCKETKIKISSEEIAYMRGIPLMRQNGMHFLNIELAELVHLRARLPVIQTLPFHPNPLHKIHIKQVQKRQSSMAASMRRLQFRSMN